MAMLSIYIGQPVWSAAAPLTVRMCVRLGGVAIVYCYPYPALLLEYYLFRVIFDSFIYISCMQYIPIMEESGLGYHPVHPVNVVGDPVNNQKIFCF